MIGRRGLRGVGAVVALVLLPSIAPDVIGRGCPHHTGHAADGHPGGSHHSEPSHHSPTPHHPTPPGPPPHHTPPIPHPPHPRPPTLHLRGQLPDILRPRRPHHLSSRRAFHRGRHLRASHPTGAATRAPARLLHPPLRQRTSSRLSPARPAPRKSQAPRCGRGAPGCRCAQTTGRPILPPNGQFTHPMDSIERILICTC